MAGIQQGVMSLPVLVPRRRKLGNKITCKTKLFNMYMAFDITEPRWCLYLKNLILFLLINLQKKSKTFAITMSPLNGFSLTTEAAVFFLSCLFRLCIPLVGGWQSISEISPRDSKAKRFTQDFTSMP